MLKRTALGFAVFIEGGSRLTSGVQPDKREYRNPCKEENCQEHALPDRKRLDFLPVKPQEASKPSEILRRSFAG
jgi:hypothetical protein